MSKKILVIQTAFTGDVILATALLESIHHGLPDAQLHVLVRKGNESLLEHHPFVEHILIWNKKKNKWKNLFSLLNSIRKTKYDIIINLQRFASTGLLTAFSGASMRIGFDKNPFSLLFDHKVSHTIGDGRHETLRNHDLIRPFTSAPGKRPALYPTSEDKQTVAEFQSKPYVCMAPGSVWFTKKWPTRRWIELIHLHLEKYPNQYIFLLGSPAEDRLCSEIVQSAASGNVKSLSGQLSLLQSASLMQSAEMNYVNDSAPLHLASAMNAPVTAIFCSTLPDFGFGPLSDKSTIIQIQEKLSCRPCGLHGYNHCPEKHFDCALKITAKEVIA
jgi:heptosyltransferase-2